MCALAHQANGGGLRPRMALSVSPRPSFLGEFTGWEVGVMVGTSLGHEWLSVSPLTLPSWVSSLSISKRVHVIFLKEDSGVSFQDKRVVYSIILRDNYITQEGWAVKVTGQASF